MAAPGLNRKAAARSAAFGSRGGERQRRGLEGPRARPGAASERGGRAAPSGEYRGRVGDESRCSCACGPAVALVTTTPPRDQGRRVLRAPPCGHQPPPPAPTGRASLAGPPAWGTAPRGSNPGTPCDTTGSRGRDNGESEEYGKHPSQLRSSASACYRTRRGYLLENSNDRMVFYK